MTKTSDTGARTAGAAAIRTFVLVEGDSDAAAVRALADRIGLDLDLHRCQVC